MRNGYLGKRLVLCGTILCTSAMLCLSGETSASAAEVKTTVEGTISASWPLDTPAPSASPEVSSTPVPDEDEPVLNTDMDGDTDSDVYVPSPDGDEDYSYSSNADDDYSYDASASEDKLPQTGTLDPMVYQMSGMGLAGVGAVLVGVAGGLRKRKKLR